jgi:hypothetical protein
MTSNVQTLSPNRQTLNASDFFKILEDHLIRFIEENFSDIEDISFFIWGGVAAELFLFNAGKLKKRLSRHDIEICLTKNGVLLADTTVVRAIEKILLNEPKLQLRTGGTRITDSKAGMTFLEFQSTRINLSDGDLFLNNIALLYSKDTKTWEFSIPTPLEIGIENKILQIDMKPYIELTEAPRIARRVVRNISKAIRFELASELKSSEKFHENMHSLVVSFFSSLYKYISVNQSVSNSNSNDSTPKWLAENGIESEISAKHWLFDAACSEIAMRTIGLYMEGIVEYERFQEFVLYGDSTFTLLHHPLTKELAKAVGLNEESAFSKLKSSLPAAYLKYRTYAS